MTEETFWIAVGSVCAVVTIVWSIFTFIIQSQFKSHRSETQTFHTQLSKDIGEMKNDIKVTQEGVSDIKITQAVHGEKIDQLESRPNCKNYSAKISKVINPLRKRRI